MRCVEVKWEVNGRTIRELRVTDMAPQKLAQHLRGVLDSREYRVGKIQVDGKEVET